VKAIPPALQAHLDSGATTLCWCWKVRRADGLALGFTDHDRDVVFDGTTFEAASGFTATEIQSSLGLSVDNLEVDSALSSVKISADDLKAGRYDDAEVEIWRVNWADPDQRVLIRKGNIGEVRRGELAFSAEIRGLAHRLGQAEGRTYQRLCDADLGDSRCGIDLEDPAFRGSGSVVSAVDSRMLTVSGLGAFADDWFTFGRLAWTSGANAGTAVEVRRHAKASSAVTLVLWQSAPLPVEAGDTFEVTAGCDKIFATCKAKFANTDNFRGFPHMPGNDFAFSYAVRDGESHDGGSFFN
jgi:uncharacterized phage protein (TIGR02218 family)